MIITQITDCIVTCASHYCGIVETYSPVYASMTLKIEEEIQYNISRNPTRTISSVKVCTARDITHKLYGYESATSLNRRPQS
jgi:hypothetical protein